MIDPIAAYPPVNPLMRLELAQLMAPAPLPPVSAADQARFQQALRPVAETPAAVRPATIPEMRVEPPLTPGEAILQTLDKMRSGYRELAASIDATMKEPDLSPQALLGLQIQVSQVTLSTQVVNQVASKVEQDMNALLKSA